MRKAFKISGIVADCLDLSQLVSGGKLAGVTGLEPATSAVTVWDDLRALAYICIVEFEATLTRRHSPAIRRDDSPPVLPPGFAAGESSLGNCEECSDKVTPEKRRADTEQKLQPERQMATIDEGISVERKTDGTVVLTISGKLFRPDEPKS